MKAFTKFTDGELVAYWNILQTPTLGSKKHRHIKPLSSEMAARKIPHETNKRTVAK